MNTWRLTLGAQICAGGTDFRLCVLLVCRGYPGLGYWIDASPKSPKASGLLFLLWELGVVEGLADTADCICRGNLTAPALFWTLAGGSWMRCVGGAGMPKGEQPLPPELRSRVQGGGAAAPPRWGREGRRPVGLGRGGAHPLGHKRAQPFHRGTRLSAVAMVTGWPGGGRGPPAPAAPVLTGRV